MTNIYYAQPYNIDAEGFYFRDYEDYLRLATGHTDRFGQPVEEFRLQFSEGDLLSAYLFDAWNISSGPCLKSWIDELEDLDYWEMLAALYLAQTQGYTVNDILNYHLDDVFFFEGSVEDYAREEIESCGCLATLPDNLQAYFDYEAFGRDLVLGGDVCVWVGPEGQRYIVREA